MATRPPRLKRPHTYFHVMSRGGNRWNIFLNDEDRQRFIYLLAAICKRYGIEVHMYCLMGNHFHIVIYCSEPVLSSAMRDLKSRYARYFNERHNGTGPVFEAPFVEVPILDDEHLKTEIRYVARNPLDLDPNSNLATAPWSSHGIYLGLRPCPWWFRTRIGLELFGPSYQADVETPRPTDKVQNRMLLNVDTPGVSTFSATPDWSLGGIRQEVAHAAGCDIGDVRPRLRNGLVGVAALAAIRIAGFSAAEVADPYGFSSRASAHAAARRAEQRLTSDPTLSAVYLAVEERMRRAA